MDHGTPAVEDLLSRFGPSPTRLLDALRARVDGSMLLTIAQADYGCRTDEHLAALLPIRDTGAVPPVLAWCPGEVLELIRWFEPEDPTWRPGVAAERGHLLRAFSCAVLVGASVQPGSDIEESNPTIAQLVGSSVALGPQMAEACRGLLTWLLLEAPPPSWNPSGWPFACFGLLLLSVALADLEPADLLRLSAWLEAEEAWARAQEPMFLTDRWLLGLTSDNLKEQTWIELARHLLLHPATPHPGEAAESLEIVGRLVVEG